MMSAIADCTLVPVEGGPHSIAWRYSDEVNAALLRFLCENSSFDPPHLLPLQFCARQYAVFARIGVTQSGRCSELDAGPVEVNINFWRSS